MHLNAAIAGDTVNAKKSVMGKFGKSAWYHRALAETRLLKAYRGESLKAFQDCSSIGCAIDGSRIGRKETEILLVQNCDSGQVAWAPPQDSHC